MKMRGRHRVLRCIFSYLNSYLFSIADKTTECNILSTFISYILFYFIILLRMKNKMLKQNIRTRILYRLSNFSQDLNSTLRST